MPADDPPTEALLRNTAQGDERALHQLLNSHRPRLKRMIALRLDRRLASRLDASDIVQETLADAARNISEYLRDRPLPFYPWLHRLAIRQLIQTHRQHIQAQARDVRREDHGDLPLPDQSAILLADRLVTSGTTPSGYLIRDEQRRLLQGVLDRMAPNDRELLVMCYLEGHSFGEIAAVLGITEGAVKVRHFRSLERIRKMMDRYGSGEAGR